MTIFARIPVDTAQRLYGNAAAILEALTVLPFDTADQLPLPIPGIDQALDESMAERDVHLQAIEAFMDERNDLRAEVSFLTDCNDRQAATIGCMFQEKDMQAEGARIVGAENAQLRDENDALAKALTRNSLWMLQVRDTLSRLGITIDTDELDEPSLTIDLPALSGGIESFLGLPG